KQQKTYSSGYSLVVTHLTTNPPVTGLMIGERTGPNALLYQWSYVLVLAGVGGYVDGRFGVGGGDWRRGLGDGGGDEGWSGGVVDLGSGYA
ncbi:hypothetical protein P154DRAFT_450371, partial [Amniculicola lignicola CBS 123094]